MERDPGPLHFAPFALDPRERVLTLHGKPVKIGARALDILILLASRSGELVAKAEILETVWPSQQIDEAALRVHLSALRRVLGLAQGSAPLIVNVTGRGYRFVSRDERQADEAVKDSASREPMPHAAPPRELVGRSDVLAELLSGWSRCDLLTITGPAGAGKSAVAEVLLHEIGRQSGVTVRRTDLSVPPPGFFPSLSPMPSCDPLSADRLSGLAGEPETILFLDNCDHHLDAVAANIEKLCRQGTRPRILMTSREPLRVAGETIFRLRPLDCEADKGDPDQVSPALRLLMQAAVLPLGQACWSMQDQSDLGEIARRLDGLPLALEMAADLLQGMAPREILRRLDRPLDILTRGRRTAPPRQQSLRACLAWTQVLLKPAEERVLARLSDFATAFTLEAAVGHAASSDLNESAVVDALSALVGKSLVLQERRGPVSVYRISQAVRQLAAERQAPCRDRKAAPTMNEARDLSGQGNANKLGFITFPGMSDLIQIDDPEPGRWRPMA